MAINWVDRVATHPGRVQLTPVQGQTNIYDMERADEPTVAGTPVNAANLNAMQKNMGLDANMTVYVAVSGSDATGNGSSTAPYQTITKALSTIPKNLNGFDATIYVSSGTYNENVLIKGFSMGRIIVTGVQGSAVQIKVLTVNNSSVLIGNIALTVDGVICAQVGNLYADIVLTVTSGAQTGIYVQQFSNMVVNTAIINGSIQRAIWVVENSFIYADKIQGSNNTNVGIGASGGIVTFNSNTLSAAVAYQTSVGGRIYAGSQTSIPNY